MLVNDRAFDNSVIFIKFGFGGRKKMIPPTDVRVLVSCTFAQCKIGYESS